MPNTLIVKNVSAPQALAFYQLFPYVTQAGLTNYRGKDLEVTLHPEVFRRPELTTGPSLARAIDARWHTALSDGRKRPHRGVVDALVKRFEAA